MKSHIAFVLSQHDAVLFVLSVFEINRLVDAGDFDAVLVNVNGGSRRNYDSCISDLEGHR